MDRFGKNKNKKRVTICAYEGTKFYLSYKVIESNPQST